MEAAAKVAFWIVAMVASILYGVFAFDIHVWTRRTEDGANPAKHLKPACRIHQGWFNFVGSVVGWFALWSLCPRILKCLGECCEPYALSWGTAATAVVALLGVTGYLPLTLYSLAAYGAQKAATAAAGGRPQGTLPG